MAQVLKSEVRERIVAAACDEFFRHGFDAASITGIAKGANVSAANIYRYFPDKSALFDAAIPDALIERHDALLDERIAALVEPMGSTDAAHRLLDFWVEHRLAVATLLDHHGETTRSGYRDHFVERLVTHVIDALETPPTAAQVAVVRIVFDNTRRAIATILRSDDVDDIRELIAGFWSYQLPGLDGLMTWLRTSGGDDVHA